MSNIGGYLANMDADLRERIEDPRYFTDAIRSTELRPGNLATCFISFDGQSIEYSGLLRRRQKVSTAKHAVKFSDFIELDPVRFEEILADIDPRYRHHVAWPFSGTVHAVPELTWSALLSTIKRLRPGSATALDLLEDRARQHRQTQAAARGYDVMAEEKDAVSLAMTIFGVNRDEELSNWVLTADRPAPFIIGLRGSTLREDTMINHDAPIFGKDWERVRNYQIGAAEFRERRSGQRLTIMNVNRTNVERTMGVDLLYYHHKYHSFVMVQYKRMAQEFNANNETEYVYRPTDRSYREELSRMKQFETSLPDLQLAGDIGSYRLHVGAFYFKLCPSVDFDPLSSDLIKGMYLPLDYWEVLEQSPEARGKRGGFTITWSNVGRHINNTLFIQLAQSGWIGTRLKRTDKLVTLIQQSLEQDRSVILATTSA